MTRADWAALAAFLAMVAVLTFWFVALATGPHPYN